MIQNAGSAVTGTINIAETSATTGLAEVTRARIRGTLAGNDLKFHEVGGSSLPAIGFAGTLGATEIAGTLRSGSSVQHVRLLALHHALAAFATAIKALDSRSRAAHAMLESAIMRLGSHVTQLARESSALASDVAALSAAFQSEVVGVKAARADVANTLAAATIQPAAPHAAICNSVSSSVAAVAIVADDADFVAGFIHGLNASNANVSKLATSLSTSTRRLGVDVVQTSSTPTTVPGAAAITSGLSRALAVVASTSARATQIAALAQADLTIVYDATNSMIAATRCRGPLIEPTPSGAAASA